MAASERAVDRGARLGRAILRDLGEQARLARVAAGLSQREVGRAVGVSHPAIGRMERGEPSTTVFLLARYLAVVGLDITARAYPGRIPHRDAAHARLLGRLRARLPANVTWRTEVPLPGHGEQRAWDAVVTIGPVRIAIEAETRARDGQELMRRLRLKRRDGPTDRLILLLADTRGNRAFLHTDSETLASDFPVAGVSAVSRLAAGVDPGGDAVVIM